MLKKMTSKKAPNDPEELRLVKESLRKERKRVSDLESQLQKVEFSLKCMTERTNCLTMHHTCLDVQRGQNQEHC